MAKKRGFFDLFRSSDNKPKTVGELTRRQKNASKKPNKRAEMFRNAFTGRDARNKKYK